MAIVLNRIGDIHHKRSQLNKSLEYYQHSLDLRKDLFSDLSSPQNQRDVAVALNRVGEIYVKLEQFDKALECYEYSLELTNKLIAKSSTPRNQRDLNYVLNCISDINSSNFLDSGRLGLRNLDDWERQGEERFNVPCR